MKITFIMNLLCIFSRVHSKILHYSLYPQKTAYYQCYRQQTGLDRILTSLLDDGKEFDVDSMQNIRNAVSVGMKV